MPQHALATVGNQLTQNILSTGVVIVGTCYNQPLAAEGRSFKMTD